MPKETTVSQRGSCPSQSMTTLGIYAGDGRSVQQRVESIIRDLQYLIGHIELEGLNPELEEGMIAILNIVEELDCKLSNIVERTESSQSGEDLNQ